MTNWGDMLAEIRRTLKEATADHWTDAELLSRANIALRDICRKTRCLTDHNIQTLTEDQAAYSYPSAGLGMPIEVRVKSSSSDSYTHKCKIISKTMLDTTYSEWGGEDGDPKLAYFEDGKVKLVPIPDTTIASGLDIRYVLNPTDMSATTAEPFRVGSTGHDYLNGYIPLIVDHVLWKCFLEDGSEGLSERYRKSYFYGVDEMEKELRGNAKALAWGSRRKVASVDWLSKLEA